MPEIVGDESVGIKYAINGLLSLTPDALPILGETPEVRGLWSAAAVWVKEGPGVGRALAEWMVRGRARDRPPGLRHRPLLRAPEERGAREGARLRGLQQDLRDRPSRRAVGFEPRRAPVAVPRARATARGGLLRGRGLGAAPLVRVQPRACSRSTARRTGARPSGTRAGGRRSSTPSTWPCATARRCSTSRRSASSTSSGPARSSACSGWPSARWT